MGVTLLLRFAAVKAFVAIEASIMVGDTVEEAGKADEEEEEEDEEKTGGE